jgi:hypothetical protein
VIFHYIGRRAEEADHHPVAWPAAQGRLERVKRRLDSLRGRAAILLGGVLLFVIAAIGLRAVERRDADLAQALRQLQAQAENTARQQREALREAQDLVIVLLAGRDVLAFASATTCGLTLKRLADRNPALANVAIVLSDGKVACAARDVSILDVQDSRYYKPALTQAGWSSPSRSCPASPATGCCRSRPRSTRVRARRRRCWSSRWTWPGWAGSSACRPRAAGCAWEW